MSQEFEHPQQPSTGLGGFRKMEAIEIPSSEEVLGEIAEDEGTARALHGCHDLTLHIVGKTVASQREDLRAIMNFDQGASALINGQEVSDSYIIKKNDVLEFLKLAGDKGNDVAEFLGSGPSPDPRVPVEKPVVDVGAGIQRWIQFTPAERAEILGGLESLSTHREGGGPLSTDTNLDLREEIEKYEQKVSGPIIRDFLREKGA